MEKDITIRISELMDLFDEGEVTTADKIERPQSSLDREMFQDANIRLNKAGGGMLVQPSADGSRPGYARPIAETGVSAYIREVLGKLPKGGRFDAEALARDIIKKFPDTSKSFIDKRDGSISTSTIFKVIERDKLLKPLELKPYNQTEKTIIRVQNFIDSFIKENERNPTVGEVKIGAKTDPTQLTKYKKQGLIKGMQDTIFDAHEIAIDYLNKNEKPSIKELEKLVGGAQRVKNAKTLLSNMYLRTLEAMRNRAAGINQPSSVYKNFSIQELDSLRRKIRSVPGYKDIYSRQIEDLVSEAYKDQPKKLETALKKIGKFKKLNQELQKLGINLQLDHPLSYDFLKKAKEGIDPEELIRVKPIPDRVNLFKSNLDNKLIEISDTLTKQPGDKNALNLYQDIQSIAGDLEVDVGKISKAGNVISAQAAKVGDVPLLPEVRKGAERQNAFREFVKNISNDPRIQRLGINLKELKNLAKLPKVNPAKYAAAIEKFVKQSGKFGVPFVIAAGGADFLKKQGIGFDKEYEPIASAGDTPIVEQGLSTAEKIGAGTTGALALGTKRGRNILGRAVGAGFGPTGLIGLTLGTGGYDLTNPIDRLSLGAEAAFAPELVKGTIGATKGMKNRAVQKGIQRVLNLGLKTPTALRFARVASPIGIASLGLEGAYQYGKFVKDELDRIKQMTPEEREAYNIEQQEQMGVSAAEGGLIGDKSGPPPESGPMSQGLQGLMKRGMKG